MRKSWKRSAAVMLVLCLVIGVGQALGWEFSMQGDWNWEYKYYSQMGHNGFFGRYDVSNGAFDTSGANSNGWLGNEILWDRLTAGTDASASSMYMHLNPEFRINEALRVRGSYYIGSWGFEGGPYADGLLNAPEYFTNTIPGRQSSFSPGYWNTLWASAQTPWGVVVLGKRPFSFGTGLILDGEDNTTYEGLLLVVPYGPFRFGGAWMPWTTSSNVVDGFDPETGYEQYVMADKNGVQDVRVGGFFTYDAGPVSCGALTEYFRWHIGPDSQFYESSRYTFITRDTTLQYGTAYAKFNNGRFFFNAEAAFIKRDTHRQNSYFSPNTDNVGVFGGTINPVAPTYLEHGRYMVEFGGYSGPAKLSFLWAYVEGGEDRRYGILIDRQADTRTLPLFSNYSLFRPYSILLAWNYGTGNGSYTARPIGADGIGSDNGYVTDANTYACRLDYAVAANLNVYGSYFYAERLSKGYGFGYVNPTVGRAVTYGNRTNGFGGSFVVPPAIPDNALGYEIDAGFDWKLLEGYTVSLAAGYWVPGKWFNFACADRSVKNWYYPWQAVNFAVNPNRTIDPVLGLDVVLKAEF